MESFAFEEFATHRRDISTIIEKAGLNSKPDGFEFLGDACQLVWKIESEQSVPKVARRAALFLRTVSDSIARMNKKAVPKGIPRNTLHFGAAEGKVVLVNGFAVGAVYERVKSHQQLAQNAGMFLGLDPELAVYFSETFKLSGSSLNSVKHPVVLVEG